MHHLASTEIHIHQASKMILFNHQLNNLITRSFNTERLTHNRKDKLTTKIFFFKDGHMTKLF